MSIKKLFVKKNSKISGKGNFARENLPKNTNLGIGLRQIKNTGNPDSDYRRTTLGAFTNHSKNPNVFFKKENDKYYFFTAKDIKKDKELTIDYNLFDFPGKKVF